MSTHINETSNIPKIEELTQKITLDLKHQLEIGEGKILECMKHFADTIDIIIVFVVKNNGKYETLYINKFGKDLLEKSGYNRDMFDGKLCLGYNKKLRCPMKEDCAAEQVWKSDVNYIFRRGVVGPITSGCYDVLLLPLKFNGTKAVIEYWIPSKCDI